MTTRAPASVDFTMYQGQNWSTVFNLYSDTAQTIPYDCTGCEIDMHIREGVADSSASIILAASTRTTGSGANKIAWLSYFSDGTVDKDGGGNQAEGIFLVSFTATDMTSLSPSKKPRKGAHETADFIYDIEITRADGSVRRFMQGIITVDLEVTRRG